MTVVLTSSIDKDVAAQGLSDRLRKLSKCFTIYKPVLKMAGGAKRVAPGQTFPLRKAQTKSGFSCNLQGASFVSFGPVFCISRSVLGGKKAVTEDWQQKSQQA